MEGEGARVDDSGISKIDGAKTDDRIETEEILETEDGVLERLVTEGSEEMGVGDGTLGGSETLDGVGVRDEEGEEGIETEIEELISEMGERRDMSEVTTDVDGLKPDVSYEISGPSGRAWDCTEGDACRKEES